MKPYYVKNISAQRKALLKSAVAKPFLNDVIEGANYALKTPCPPLTMEAFNLYYQTGNRLIFEETYFARRRHLSDLMMAFWLTEDQRYYEPMVSYIEAICAEFTWCLPAHADLPNRTLKEAKEWVDLFQAETARLFAEIILCVADSLQNSTKEQMKVAIQERIFASFDSGVTYWWENSKMNWATVCGAGCAMAYLVFGTTEEQAKHLPRFRACLDSYLEGIGEDGCCQEGMAYWSYGFSHFLILANALFVHSEGKIDYLSHPKVHALALFPQKIYMSDGKAAAFSDSHEAFTFKIGMLSFLKAHFPDVRRPDLAYGTRRGNVDSISELLWFDPCYKTDPLPEETHYLADSRWYISRREAFAFAAKGGHNDEPHNHNDIGAFMVIAKGETVIADLGCGEYVKETFLPETRYTFLQNASLGHSVPIINGICQHEGPDYTDSATSHSNHSFALNLENAYPPCGLLSLRRHFVLSKTSLRLVDEFSFTKEENALAERFITKIPPQIAEGAITIGKAKLLYDSDIYEVCISTERYTAHNSTEQVTVYAIDLCTKTKNTHRFSCEFSFD